MTLETLTWLGAFVAIVAAIATPLTERPRIAIVGMCTFVVALTVALYAFGQGATDARVWHDSDHECEAMELRADEWVCTRLVREP